VLIVLNTFARDDAGAVTTDVRVEGAAVTFAVDFVGAGDVMMEGDVMLEGDAFVMLARDADAIMGAFIGCAAEAAEATGAAVEEGTSFSITEAHICPIMA